MVRFELRTAHPRMYHEFVLVIAEDQTEYLTWRVSAAAILRELGRAHEASGPSPRWPLRNVVLVNDGVDAR
ncbi:hypothetical protein [Mesorhizobium helmanticense]|nr:hypothetical protein [Mesorhizobium helmanticense]